MTTKPNPEHVREQTALDLMEVESLLRQAAVRARKLGMPLDEFLTYSRNEHRFVAEHIQDYCPWLPPRPSQTSA